VALCSDYPDFSQSQVQIANLILCISQRMSGGEFIDRAMLCYVLRSREDYRVKLARLSADTNYYLAMHDEDKFAGREYGF
jgi:hypothetical protein